MSHKYLVISGASTGIGESTAQLFQSKGWTVINISRQNCQFAVKNFNIDLTAENWADIYSEQLQVAVAGAEKICLVHNAAYYIKDTIMKLPAQQLRIVLEANVVAPSILNQIFLPLMPAGSSILYIGSTLSDKAVSHAASYVTSKHAILGLMRATCQDLDGKHIHTCCICPGTTDTEMLRKHVQYEEQQLEAMRAMNAFKRLVKPNEIAELIEFAAEQPVINGSVLHANLGQIAT